MTNPPAQEVPVKLTGAHQDTDEVMDQERGVWPPHQTPATQLQRVRQLEGAAEVEDTMIGLVLERLVVVPPLLDLPRQQPQTPQHRAQLVDQRCHSSISPEQPVPTEV